MKLKLTGMCVAVALATSASAFGGLLSKEEIKSTQDRIAAEFKTEKQACENRSGNAKDICMAEVKGNERVAKAELEARDKGTSKARQEALVAKAEANYDVATERCDDLAGNPKAVCIKDAKAALVKAKADARLDRTVMDTRAEASGKIGEARTQAAMAKRDADFKAARERCESLAGAAKDNCVVEAKTAFGM